MLYNKCARDVFSNQYIVYIVNSILVWYWCGYCNTPFANLCTYTVCSYSIYNADTIAYYYCWASEWLLVFCCGYAAERTATAARSNI